MSMWGEHAGGLCVYCGPLATWPLTRVHLEVSGPAPGQWNTRTPAALCARRFCGSFFRRASHSQPAGPRTARAGRGARSGDPSPHLSGPDWSPRPAWTTSWCKRVKRRAPASPPVPAHTPAHTPAHAPAQHDFDADDSERRTIGGNGTRHAPAPHPQMAPGCPHTRSHQVAHAPGFPSLGVALGVR